MKRLLFRQSIHKWGVWCNCFDAVCMGSAAIIRLCRYIVYLNHLNDHNYIYIGVATRRVAHPVKDRDTLIEQSVTGIYDAHWIIVKQVIYDEFVRIVRHSFNTTGTANYRVQLAVPKITNHNNTVLIKS